MSVKVGVIGVGAWGKNHVRVYSELARAKLVFVADVNRARAKRLARRYGAEWYTSYVEALRHGGVDAVSICTPTSTHMEIASHVIEKGVNVLLEKPFTGNSADAERLISLAERRGVVLMPGFIERFNPTLSRVKRAVGQIGRLYVVEAERMSRRRPSMTDVGVLRDLAIHDIDVIRLLLGSDYESVFGYVASTFRDHPSDATLLLKAGEVSALVRASWHSYRKVRQLRVMGSKATVFADYLTQEVTIYSERRVTRLIHRWREPLKEELRHFVKVVGGGGEPSVRAEDAVYALKVIETATGPGKGRFAGVGKR